MFFGILFDFLGVSRQSIADEYNLTELGLRHMRDDIVARLIQSPAFANYIASQQSGAPLSNEELSALIAQEKKTGDSSSAEVSPEALEKGRQAAIRMVGARKESMLGALEMLDREFGGADAYMREKCGVSAEEIERLRVNLVERN
jgi:hypothetical protein